MGDDHHEEKLLWYNPRKRGVIPLKSFHIPRRLRRTVRSGKFEIFINKAFDAVIRACAEPALERKTTWINETIIRLYSQLHLRGYVQTVESWRDQQLVGGLYGVTLGSVFFGESMFCHERDASKVALVHLVGRLRLAGFRLLDTQFLTKHLSQFGAIEIGEDQYRSKLRAALDHPKDFLLNGRAPSIDEVLQSITQTS